MKPCRTRAGTLRLYHEGQWIDLVDHEARELPDELAESIRTHVNVVVEDAAPPPAPSAAKPAAPKKKEPPAPSASA